MYFRRICNGYFGLEYITYFVVHPFMQMLKSVIDLLRVQRYFRSVVLVKPAFFI